MKKKLVIVIGIISLACVGAWFLLRVSEVDKEAEKKSSTSNNNPVIDGKPAWLKANDLNQKVSEKQAPLSDQKSVEEVSSTDTPPVLDARIGKEDPNMVEHFDAKDTPPLDMMSVEEQEEINRQMKVKPEDVGKGINEAEMNPDIAEIEKNIDMKEMNPDIKEIEKLLEKTK